MLVHCYQNQNRDRNICRSIWIRSGSIPSSILTCYFKVNNELVLYRAADLPFTDRTRQKLLDNRVDRLYVPCENRDKYQRYIEVHLDKILTDRTIHEEKKAAILYDTSTNLVKDVLSNPTYGDNIHRSEALVSNTVDYILKGRDAFLNLMKITSFDYYTYTHSVNVCTFSVALAQQIGIKDERFMHELGVGALLHDIGKSRISDRILNKRSTLTPIEFEIMKKHPELGRGDPDRNRSRAGIGVLSGPAAS